MNITLTAGCWFPLLTGLGGLLALLFARQKKISAYCGCIGAAAGAISGLAAVSGGFSHGLHAAFQLPILVLTAAGAVYSLGYLKGHGEERSGYYWLFYNLTAASMWCVTLANTPFHFLIAWEAMGLASFALVAFDSRKEQIRRAAWIYLLACQAGAFFLILMFYLHTAPVWGFIFGLIGFGLKIGFPLLHVWLPEAHPAAPAPVSALMSGAMIQLGFYGIIVWTPAGSLSVGWILLIPGLIAAPTGILLALPRRNLKELLAYSSVENMGILAIAFGLCLLASKEELITASICASCGAVLHAWNHALLKGGLFLGAGSVLKACHTLDIDKMGGLLKRMPKTGALFILNSCALSGLPPFNGFLSEFLIYLAAVYMIMEGSGILVLTGVLVLIVLAFTGGIAAAAYAKAIGGVFLGEPRSDAAAQAEEVPKSMFYSTASLCLLSFGTAAASPLLISMSIAEGTPVVLTGKVTVICLAGILFFLLIAAFHFRKSLTVRESVTWDCGYAKPDARMEYTGTAFTQPLTDFFHTLLRFRKKEKLPEKLFPEEASYSFTAEDPALSLFWTKLFHAAGKLAEKVHKLQSGSLHLYILIMTIALLLLLVWGLILPWSGKLIQGGF